MFNVTNELTAVNLAYSYLARKVAATHEANEAAVTAKCDLERARAEALFAGVEGKNEAAREASLRQNLAVQYDALATADSKARGARHTAELAQIEVDRVRLRVRLMELAAGQEGGGR